MCGQIDFAILGVLEDGTVLAGEVDVDVVAEQKDAAQNNQNM